MSLPLGIVMRPHLDVVQIVLLGQIGNFHLTFDELAAALFESTLPVDVHLPFVEEDEFALAVVGRGLALDLVHFGELAVDGVLREIQPHEQLFKPILGPGAGILLRPVPIVDVCRVRPIFDDPARVSFAPLGHVWIGPTRTT